MQDGAVKVYDRFLEARARNQGLNFRMDGAVAQGLAVEGTPLEGLQMENWRNDEKLGEIWWKMEPNMENSMWNMVKYGTKYGELNVKYGEIWWIELYDYINMEVFLKLSGALQGMDHSPSSGPF